MSSVLIVRWGFSVRWCYLLESDRGVKERRDRGSDPEMSADVSTQKNMPPRRLLPRRPRIRRGNLGYGT